MLNKITLLFLLLTQINFGQQKDITVASWNIKDFGKTKNANELDSIANVIKHTDIVAIQEVVAGYGGAQAVAKLAEILNRKGAKWDYAISNPTTSPKYVTERYAYVWKTKYIKIKNRGRLLKELDQEIDREPYLIEFYINKAPITLLNLHARPYNKNPEAEIKALTAYITKTYTKPVILAGDFNVYESNTVFNSFKTSGYATALTNQKTTLKKACKNTQYRNHPIDNIFYSNAILKTDSGVLDFVKSCGNLEKARMLSDHLPVYLKFVVE